MRGGCKRRFVVSLHQLSTLCFEVGGVPVGQGSFPTHPRASESWISPSSPSICRIRVGLSSWAGAWPLSWPSGGPLPGPCEYLPGTVTGHGTGTLGVSAGPNVLRKTGRLRGTRWSLGAEESAVRQGTEPKQVRSLPMKKWSPGMAPPLELHSPFGACFVSARCPRWFCLA